MNTKTEKQLPLTNIPWTSVQLPRVTYRSLPQTGNLVYLCIFFSRFSAVSAQFYIPIIHLQEVSFSNKCPGHQPVLSLPRRTKGKSCPVHPQAQLPPQSSVSPDGRWPNCSAERTEVKVPSTKAETVVFCCQKALKKITVQCGERGNALQGHLHLQ